jgi:GT2 family glycosyltransferase
VSTISVIVVSYRPGDWLRPCLRSVVERVDEVIVVDNGSPGRAAATIAREIGARTVESRDNLGFAGGVAAGLQAARGDLVALLNDDATAGDGWPQSAASLLEDPSIGAVTPKVVFAGEFAEIVLDDEAWYAPRDRRALGRQVRSITVGGEEVLARAVGAGLHELEEGDGGRWRWTSGPKPFYVPWRDGASVRVDGEPVEPRAVVPVINHAGSYLRAHGTAGEFGLGAPDDGRFDQPAERFGFSGTAPVFRAETLHRLGAFATEFFAYNEDTDWCLRCRLAGLKVMFDPAGTVRHRSSATSGGTASLQVRRLAQRNALLCLVRNAPADVAAREVAERLRRDWRGWVGREVARKLPWAVASRRSLARGWRLEPRRVWERWAERDMTWEDRPATRDPRASAPRPAAGAPLGGPPRREGGGGAAPASR